MSNDLNSDQLEQLRIDLHKNLKVDMDRLSKDVQSEVTKRVTGWSISFVVGFLLLACFGAWTLLKPVIINQLQIVPRPEVSELLEGAGVDQSGIDLSGAIVLFTRGSSCPNGSRQVSDLHLLLRNDSGLFAETAALALDDSKHDGGSGWSGHRFYGCHFK